MEREASRPGTKRRLGRGCAALLAALMLGACVGEGSPRTSIDPEKPRDTCQHTMEGGQAKTVCF